MNINAINYKVVFQNVRDQLTIDRTASSIALATLMTAIFHASVISYDRYINEHGVYAEGRFNISTLCINAFLLAVPGILRYFIEPTHLDKYVPYNAKDLFKVAALIGTCYLIAYALKEIVVKLDLPAIVLADRKYKAKMNLIDTKLSKLEDIEARLTALEFQGQIEGPIGIKKVEHMSPPEIEQYIQQRVEICFQRKIADFRKGEMTPTEGSDSLELLLAKSGIEIETPNPGNTPRGNYEPYDLFQLK